MGKKIQVLHRNAPYEGVAYIQDLVFSSVFYHNRNA